MRSSSEVTHEDTKRELALSVLAEHGHCRLHVHGSSMLPALWPEEEVLIETHPLAELEVGSVVLFDRAGHLFLHRVKRLGAGVADRVVTTRGDAIPQEDAPLAVSDLLGVLVAVRRGEDLSLIHI